MAKTTSVLKGLLILFVLSTSIAYADERAVPGFPQGFSLWKATIPNGILFSIGQDERTHPLQVFRDQNGKLARGTENQLQSGNWSGYVLANYETGKTYTSATGAWIVPAAALPQGQSAGYSSSWVGIGGFCENTNCTRGDGSLIQLGTESDVKASRTSYYAWYEMLPQSEISISGLLVHPGDHITASLALQGLVRNRQSWKLSLTDTTTGASWTKTVTYQSSELSADWVEEAPSSYYGILPLANFTTATFDPESVNNGTAPSFTSSNEVIMLNPHGQTSNPSVPDSNQDGFSTCFGNGTLTSCLSPAS